MKKEVLVVFVIIIFVFGIILVSSASDYKSKIDNKIYKSLESKNTTRVVIKLKDPLLGKGLIRGIITDYDIEHEKRLAREEVLNKFNEQSVKHIFDSEIAVEATSSQIKELENDNNVDSVYVDKPIQAFLQQSVPLINATNTWPITLSGLNITGIGETICIIDTGINFSHPDLIGKNMTPCLIDCINHSSGCVQNCSRVDDNGHGTHVAGIIAANGAIKGVAIGASLIGVKVLNAAGGGYGSDLDAGIDWCTANAAAYNISVISMSLGTNCAQTPEYCYDSYCDSFSDENSTALRIDNATSHNISVIIAAGNDGSSTLVSSPGCVKNATTVSATDKSDNIASYSNRNNITDLLAPGGGSVGTGSCTALSTDPNRICSTYNNGAYISMSGTSMATPHVAGAFALIREYFRLQNGRVPTPSEIQNILNMTGKRIYDGSSNLNFSRINVYAAILSLDSIPPNVTLVSPIDNSINTSVNQSFSCSASDLQLANVTFYIWNSTNNLFYNESKNVSGISNTSYFNMTNLSYDIYKWNCRFYDLNNNSAYASSNFSLIISYLSSSLISPSNGLITNQNQSYNCSFLVSSSSPLKNTTFYMWNSSGSIVYNLSRNISGVSNSSIFSYNFTSEGNYSWNCLIFNNNSQSAFSSSNYTISYDVTAPTLNNLSASVSTTSATVTWSSNEVSNATINYSTNVSNLNNSQVNTSYTLNHSISLSGLSSSTVYYYNITSCDTAGNCLVNGTFNFTTSADTTIIPTGGGGSGGGGGGSATNSKTFAANYDQMILGYSQGLAKNDKINFNITGNSHNLVISEINSNYVNITIRSSPINIRLAIWETKKLNLSSPNYYDFSVQFNGIVNNKANITIKLMHEDIVKNVVNNVSVPVEKPVSNNHAADNSSNSNEEKSSGDLKIFNIILIVMISVLIIIIVLVFISIRIKKYKLEKNIKEYKDVFDKHLKPKNKK